MYMGASPIVIVSLFPARVRCTGISISYNVALALFGGTAPLLVTYLIERKHLLDAPGVVIASAALIATVSICTINQSQLHQDD